MNLVERIKGILLQPKSEWQAIEREPGNAGYLFPNYVAIVAAIPPVCAFIGLSIVGYGPFRLGIVSGILHAVVVYILSLISVFVLAYVIDFLAGTFGARKNLDNAMKVSAYAPTAAWLAGVFKVIPALAIPGDSGTVQSLPAVHRYRHFDEASRRQGADLYDRCYRLRDCDLDDYFRYSGSAVRRRHDVAAAQGSALR